MLGKPGNYLRRIHMKNLRKVLSLVLVVAMAASFLVFASAKTLADYPDKADAAPQYKEAIDVVSALGIFAGNDDGTLDPKGYFTRAQAAKIVTYLSIGQTAAESLTPAAAFKDVPASHWASKYIAYAKEKGILSGYGDGNYGPNDYLTGSQVAKLLNTVLGYGKKGEYEGAAWEINAISDAVSRGLITGNADLTAPALREEVIQYVFNTIRPNGANGKNYIVEYSTIVNAYLPVGTGAFQAANITIDSYIGSRNFGLSEAQFHPDEYGVTQRFWNRYGRFLVGDYLAENLIDSFVANFGYTKAKLYNDYTWQAPYTITVTNPTPPPATITTTVTATVATWVNGYNDGPVLPTTLASRGDPAPAFPQANNGLLVRLYDGDWDGAVDKVVVTYEYLAKVTKVTPAAGTINVDVYQHNTSTNALDTTSITTPIIAEGYAVGDYILITPENLDATHPDITKQPLNIAKSEIITTKVTNYTRSNNAGPVALATVTADGKTYTVNSLYSIGNPGTPSFAVDSILYLDSNGNIIGFGGSQIAASARDYLYVTSYRATTTAANAFDGNTAEVRVTYTNGQSDTLKLAVSYPGGVPTVTIGNGTVALAPATNSAAYNGWYWYSVTDDKVVSLGSNANDGSGTAITSLAVFGPINKAAGVYDATYALLSGAQTAVTTAGRPTVIGSKYADSKTILSVNGSKYTGYGAFPTLNTTANAQILFITDTVTSLLTNIYTIDAGAITGTTTFGVVTGIAYSAQFYAGYDAYLVASNDSAITVGYVPTGTTITIGAVYDVTPDTANDRYAIGAVRTATATGTVVTATDTYFVVASDVFTATDTAVVFENIPFPGVPTGATFPIVGDTVTVYSAPIVSNAGVAYAIVITAHA
jgi:hypothetical protein